MKKYKRDKKIITKRARKITKKKLYLKCSNNGAKSTNKGEISMKHKVQFEKVSMRLIIKMSKSNQQI